MTPSTPSGLFGLDGKIALVTGASSGLGRRFASVLAAAGATVALAARRTALLEDLALTLDGRGVVIACDVGIDFECEALVTQVVERLGAIDILVNNAGINLAKPIDREPVAEFRRVIDINLTAPFLLSQLAGRHMVAASSGSIVNVSSIFGLVGSAPIAQASYCASKAALANLTRELGLQWARSGVRVNALAPGWFESEMTANEIFGDEAAHAYIRRNCPMGRGGRIDELDGALLFLASAASTYVTGQVLAVDGGWTAR